MSSVRIITTEQAPSAKPLATSFELTDDWQTIIDVPVYDVPVVGFGSARRIAPGVAEPSSPIFVANTDSANVATVDVRVVRAQRPLIAGQSQTDFVDKFTGGADYGIGNIIIMENNSSVTVTNTDGNGSVTEFIITTGGEGVIPEVPVSQTEISGAGGAGLGFTISPDRDDLDFNSNVIFLARNLRVETDDVLLVPVNGQFFLSRDLLQVRASANSLLQATVSYTEGQAEENDITI